MFNFFKSKSFKSHSDSDGATLPTQSGIGTKVPKYNGVAQSLKDKIEYAFTSGGVDYFMFEAELNIPFTRFMAALDIYDELEQGINPGVLMKYVQAVNAICVDPKVKTIDQMKQKVGIASYMIEERLNIHVSLSHHMKLATVRYFDENEDPTGYDHGYNVKKIKHWTENHDVEDFFFMQPIQNLMPQLKDFQVNLAKYLEGESLQMLKTMEALTMFDTSENNDPELQNYLSLQREILEILKDWQNSRSTNTA
jgi:hypothetical protein